MLVTESLEYGTTALSFPGTEGFPWVYPARCGYQRITSPALPCGEAGGLLVYIVSGAGEARLGGEGRRCAGGCAIVADDARRVTLHPDTELVFFFLLLKNAETLLARLGESGFVTAVGDCRADRLLARMHYNACAGGIGSLYDASADTFALLMELCGHCGAPPDAFSPLVRQSLVLLREEYAFLSGVDELAERMGVSKSHLIRVFTAAVGVSPGKYLQTTKLENAKLMLQNRDYSVETVADMTGFSGANYFCKVFRRATGESPGVYRARQAPPPLDADTRRRLAALEGITHV